MGPSSGHTCCQVTTGHGTVWHEGSLHLSRLGQHNCTVSVPVSLSLIHVSVGAFPCPHATHWEEDQDQHRAQSCISPSPVCPHHAPERSCPGEQRASVTRRQGHRSRRGTCTRRPPAPRAAALTLQGSALAPSMRPLRWLWFTQPLPSRLQKARAPRPWAGQPHPFPCRLAITSGWSNPASDPSVLHTGCICGGFLVRSWEKSVF